MLAQKLLQDRKRIAFLLLFALAAPDDYFVAAGSNLHVGTRAHEGVAADVLAALDRLEQEGVRLVGGDGQEGGDRRHQVGHDGFRHRDQRGFAGEAREFFVVGTKHGCSIIGEDLRKAITTEGTEEHRGTQREYFRLTESDSWFKFSGNHSKN